MSPDTNLPTGVPETTRGRQDTVHGAVSRAGAGAAEGCGFLSWSGAASLSNFPQELLQIYNSVLTFDVSKCNTFFVLFVSLFFLQQEYISSAPQKPGCHFGGRNNPFVVNRIRVLRNPRETWRVFSN